MGGNTSSEKSRDRRTPRQKKADDAYAKAIDQAYKKNPNVNRTGFADPLKVVFKGNNLEEAGYNRQVRDAYNEQQRANVAARNMRPDGTERPDNRDKRQVTTPTTPTTPTAPTTTTTPTTPTTVGNAASSAESTSVETLRSSANAVTISDAARQRAKELGLELVNTDAIVGDNEADTLQKKQAALLEAERRQAIRRLIARNRRARFGGSRLLMSSARANPGLGVPQNQTTLSPRMNPRDSYA